MRDLRTSSRGQVFPTLRPAETEDPQLRVCPLSADLGRGTEPLASHTLQEESPCVSLFWPCLLCQGLPAADVGEPESKRASRCSPQGSATKLMRKGRKIWRGRRRTSSLDFLLILLPLVILPQAPSYVHLLNTRAAQGVVSETLVFPLSSLSLGELLMPPPPRGRYISFL